MAIPKMAAHHIQKIAPTPPIQIAVERAIFSVPAHTDYAIFMSYYLCKAKINRLKGNNKEKVDIAKLNAEIEEIVAKENVLRAEIDRIIKEIEG